MFDDDADILTHKKKDAVSVMELLMLAKYPTSEEHEAEGTHQSRKMFSC